MGEQPTPPLGAFLAQHLKEQLGNAQIDDPDFASSPFGGVDQTRKKLVDAITRPLEPDGD